jgi:hypothetical protein
MCHKANIITINKSNIFTQACLDLFNEYDESLLDIFNLDKDDFKIIKIIDQLIKPFGEFEELLNYYDLRTRVFILSKRFDIS